MHDSRFECRAQTNLQLYVQLAAAGYSREELIAVRRAYEFATRVFAAQLRPDGRPFVCHVVGVSSILAMVDAPIGTIIGGLLHSAYTHGDFGYGRGQVTRSGRVRLRKAAGLAVDQLVDCYSQHPWNRTTVAFLTANAAKVDSNLRQVALIRVADALDDAFDHALQLSRKTLNPNRPISVESLVQLAIAIEQQELGEELRRVLDVTRIPPPTFEGLQDPHAASYLVCPMSWRENILTRMIRVVRLRRRGD